MDHEPHPSKCARFLRQLTCVRRHSRFVQTLLVRTNSRRGRQPADHIGHSFLQQDCPSECTHGRVYHVCCEIFSWGLGCGLVVKASRLFRSEEHQTLLPHTCRCAASSSFALDGHRVHGNTSRMRKVYLVELVFQHTSSCYPNRENDIQCGTVVHCLRNEIECA